MNRPISPLQAAESLTDFWSPRVIAELDDGHIDLQAGDLHVIPKGMQHNPIAADECLVMLIERKSTLHTGDIRTDKTWDISEQLAEFNSGGSQSRERQK